MTGSAPTALQEAVEICTAAAEAQVTVRLAGGLAIQYLTPEFPPRGGDRQDLDLAIQASDRKPLTRFLAGRGYDGDKNFNALYGHKQLYFRSTRTNRSLDILVDRLHMCHTVEFKERLGRMPVTLDVSDLLLTKLQIVELNEKDAQDVLYLLSAYPVRDGDEPGTIGLGRILPIVSNDWGWWRTVTMNLDRVINLASGDGRALVPGSGKHAAVDQLSGLGQAIEAAPKSLRWKARAKVGERVRWYETPEESPRH